MDQLYLSWSQLRTHEECKQKSYLHRSGNRAPMGDQRVFFAGTVTDRVVRDWLLNDPADNLGLMPHMVEEIMEREREEIKLGRLKGDGTREPPGVMKWKGPGDREQVLRDCIEAVTKIEPALLKYVVPYKVTPDLRLKSPLVLPHPRGGTETVQLIGYLDIFVEDDKGRFWVWDVKHTRDDYYWKKTAGQLAFYDRMVEFKYGEPPIRVGLLQPLCKQPVKPVPVTDEKRREMMTRIAGLARDVWNKEKTPRKDTKVCNFCDAKHACEKFTPVMVNGKRRISFGGNNG